MSVKKPALTVVALFAMGVAHAHIVASASASTSPDDYFSQPMVFDDGWSGFISGSHLQLNAISGYGVRDWKGVNKSRGALVEQNLAKLLGLPVGSGIFDYDKKVLAKPDTRQWALVSMLNWKSGYEGPFGINASLYGGAKLDYSGPTTGYWLLQKNNNSMADNFARIGRLNARLSFGNKENNLLAHAGYVGVDPDYLNSTLFGVQPFPYQMTYLTMRGLTFTSQWNNLGVYGAYFDRISQAASNSMGWFRDDKGKPIDYIAMLGVNYKFALPNYQQLILEGESTQSHNYTKEYYGGMTYVLPFSETKHIVLLGKYFNTSKDGSGFSNPTMAKDGHLLNLTAQAAIDKVSLYASYSKTYAPNKGDQAYGIISNRFYYAPAANYIPQPGFLTDRVVSDFAYDGESAYLLGAGYDFSDFVNGLKAAVGYTWGRNISSRVGLHREAETDLRLDYAVPGVKGLSTTVVNSYYKSKGKSINSTVDTFVGGMGQTINDLRWFVNYKVDLF